MSVFSLTFLTLIVNQFQYPRIVSGYEYGYCGAKRPLKVYFSTGMTVNDSPNYFLYLK